MNRHSLSPNPDANYMPRSETAKKNDITCNAVQLSLTDGQTTSADRGLLIPLSLPAPFPAGHAAVHQYRYQLLAGQGRPLKAREGINGKFVIHAPSLIGIWAHAILTCVPDAAGLILDRARAGSQTWLLWLTACLRYERMRLGSDVESPYLRKYINRENLQKVLPRLTIGHWIDALDGARRQSALPDGDFIFWHDRAQASNIGPWLASRLCNKIE